MNAARPLVFRSRLDQYRQALLPAGEGVGPAALRAALLDGGPDLVNLIVAQDIGPLWHHRLQSGGMLESLPSAVREVLQQVRTSAAAGYLAQRTALIRIDGLFEAAGIPYVVMKGAQLRECVYPDASLRPAADIDILVLPSGRQRAARALLDAGYTVDADPANISHEACFVRAPVAIDLHWDILRPGRTRLDMTAGFLARRQRVNGFWGLSDADAMFLMLVHPAFTKYVSSANMGLSRVADILLWIQNRATDWSTVLNLLDMAGLRAAAWTMLSWYRMLAAPAAASVLDEWMPSLRPGRRRAAYLQYWLTHDLPGRWLNRPLRIQLGFTLFLHDRSSDAWRALRGWLYSRRNRQRDLHGMLGND